MPNYFVEEEFNAPKKSAEENGDRLQRVFKVGELIAGKPNGHGKLKGKFVHIILTHDGYVLPANNLKQVSDRFSNENADYAHELNESVSNIVDRDYVRDLMETSKKSMKGVAIGAGVGFAIALIKGKSLLWFGLIGATAGGLIGHKFAKSTSKKGKKKTDGEKEKEG